MLKIHLRLTENYIVLVCAVFCTLFFLTSVSAQQTLPLTEKNSEIKIPTANKKVSEPVIVNGDKVEYLTDTNDISATGNVSIIYKGSKLTCDRIVVNTLTKDATAEGNVRLEDANSIVRGAKIKYNLANKTGSITDATLISGFYYAKVGQIDKVSEQELIARNGYISTCSLDHPHYRIESKQVNFFPGDKVQTKGDAIYISKTPIIYLAQYNQSLKDRMMRQQIAPGYKKDWGPYVLSTWRYNLSDNVTGRIYVDERYKLGIAEGFGINYKDMPFGRGDFKFYYTHETDKSVTGPTDEFQRYFIRWRHKWDINPATNITAEYYKIADDKRLLLGSDYNILKDYFPREYEKDAQPLSYVSAHHSFSESSLDLIFQKRTNSWFSQDEKLPELDYTLPNIKLGESPFYFENVSQAANLAYVNATTGSTATDTNMVRFDTSNKFSLPRKISIIQFTPYVKNQETFYSKDNRGEKSLVRTIFTGGADFSTKFYRLFNVKSNFLGMDLNGLRHIITPTIGYAYVHTPTIPSSNLRQIDSIDAIGPSNSASLGLYNKLQTKRKGQSVDVVDFRMTSDYVFNPKDGVRQGSYLSDILFDLTLLPYSWLRVDADATLKRSGDKSDDSYNKFANANYGMSFDLGKGRSFGIGQRYQRKGSNDLTYNFTWRFNPKWSFSVYQRQSFGGGASVGRGLREQEYTISRDLHCWTWDTVYNIKSGEGQTLLFIFRLKAFPEVELNINQSYHKPESGSQNNP